MNFNFLTENLRISRKKFASVMFLNLGTLAWFFLLNLYISDISVFITSNDPTWGFYNIGVILFFGFTVLWIIVTSFIGDRINRGKLLFTSIFLGTISTILMAFLKGTISASILISLAGISLGIGLPSSLALVADYTIVENRARVSGIIILGAFMISCIIMLVARIPYVGIPGTILLLAVVRSASFATLTFDNCKRLPPIAEKKPRLSPTAYREFIYYLFPWVMFVLAAILAWNLIPSDVYEAEISLGQTLRYLFIAIFGILSGFVADRFGRKQPIIIGLIVLSFGFALLGITLSGISVIIYLAISGLTWGSFFVVFLAVPGDLSVLGSREKFYGLGYFLPLAIMFGFGAIPGADFSRLLSASSFAYILSIILILSIIPVLRAKETLPERKMRERRLKEHIEKIGKLVSNSKKK